MEKRILFILFTLLWTLSGPLAAQCPDETPSCQLHVYMHDSYGDGWNNGQLNVYQMSTKAQHSEEP